MILRLIWRRDVGQPQISDERMLRTSTLEFTTLNNVESALSISTLISTTLDNVKKTLSFQRPFLQRWTISKQRREYEHLLGIKKTNLESRRNKYFWASNKNNLNWIRWTQCSLHFIFNFEGKMSKKCQAKPH